MKLILDYNLLGLYFNKSMLQLVPQQNIIANELDGFNCVCGGPRDLHGWSGG